MLKKKEKSFYNCHIKTTFRPIGTTVLLGQFEEREVEFANAYRVRMMSCRKE